MSLTVERHAALHREILREERQATVALTLSRGKTAAQVAAEVSARAMASLKTRKENRDQ